MPIAHSVSRIALALILFACSPSRPHEPVVAAVPAEVAHANAPGDPRFDGELSAYAYPFPVRFEELRTQGQTLRMAYMDVPADKPNGHVVVLLHGKNFTASYSEPTISFLTARGYRVIPPDQIGFGKSSKPHADQYSCQHLDEHTIAVLHAAVRKAHMI